MNPTLKQNLSKVSNNCKEKSDFFLITSEHVVCKESVYEKLEQSSWTNSEFLNKESILANVGLNKSRNNSVIFLPFVTHLTLNFCRTKIMKNCQN
jgi:hypothetical protein